MPEDEPNEEQTFKQFQFGGPDTDPVVLPDEDADIGDAINTFNRLTEARRTARLPENEGFVEALAEAFRKEQDTLRRVVATQTLSRLIEELEAALERVAEEGELEDETVWESRTLKEEDGTAGIDPSLNERLEEWGVGSESVEDIAPPEPTKEIANDFLEAVEWDRWAEWTATHVMYWATRDVEKAYREEGRDPEEVSDPEWDRRFNEQLTVKEYFMAAVEIMGAQVGKIITEAFQDVSENEGLSLLQIERLLGLHEDEDDAPAPRPETEEMDPDPFQGDPPMTSLLADPFSTTAIDALREADGEPAPTYEEEWGEDSTGHPIRVEQLGNPYEGRATFKVQAFGEPDPTAVEASMGWKMLDRMDMDTVWLHLLLLGYASATHRRGDRPVIRIPRRVVERVFGFRNRNVRMENRAEKIKRHVEALQSIFVQFQEVQRHGDKLHFRGDMTSGAPLWGLRMVAEGQQDLFTGETVADWHLEAREGMWAEEFLHNHGGQWAPLPKEWFKQIDRRGSRNFAQRLAVYLLFQFRINADSENRVRKSAQTLLEVCGEDMSEPRSSKRRSELKRCLSNALDTLNRNYGIEVHASRVHMEETKGMNFEEWKKRGAAFDPPAAMDGRLFQNAEGEAPPLPDVAGDWNPKQIHHLRTEVLDETQPELGDRLDVSKQYVSQLERGTSEPSARVRKVLDGLQARHE